MSKRTLSLVGPAARLLVAFLAVVLLAPCARADTPQQVRRIMKGAATWTPAQYTRGLKAIGKLGPGAAPTLIELLRAATDPIAIANLCKALGRVPTAASLADVEARLVSQEWLVRSACGAAAGTILVASKADVSKAAAVIELVKRDRNVSVRRNTATAVGPADYPELSKWMFQVLQRPRRRKLPGLEDDLVVAIAGLSSGSAPSDAVGRQLVQLLGSTWTSDRVRDVAAIGLTRFTFPPARDLLLTLASTRPLKGNAAAFAIEALGRVGTSADIPLLQNVIADDRHGGGGFHAIKAKAAIAAIRSRR